MNNTFRAVVAGSVAAAALTLAGCSDENATVDGLRDDLQHKSAVTEVAHYENRTKSETVCTRKVKGVCKASKTVKTTSRVKVVDKPAKPALYCVELDYVNGSKDDDDAWYTVTSAAYFDASRKDEGDKVNNMSYLHTGCWR